MLLHFKCLCQLSDEALQLVCQVAKLLLIMPATNACSESSFSATRRLKTYLRIMIMILHMYKEQLDDLDFIALANQFVSGNLTYLTVLI